MVPAPFLGRHLFVHILSGSFPPPPAVSLCLSFSLALPLSIGKFGRQKPRCLFAAAERKIKCSFLHSATLPHVTHECHVFFVTCSITNYLNGWSFYAIQELPSIKRSEVILPNAKDTDRSPMPAPSLALPPPPRPADWAATRMTRTATRMVTQMATQM